MRTIAAVYLHIRTEQRPKSQNNRSVDADSDQTSQKRSLSLSLSLPLLKRTQDTHPWRRECFD